MNAFNYNTDGMDRYMEVIPGIRVIPESELYRIKVGYESGYLIHGDGSKLPFTVVNSLCSPEEMDIFDHGVLTQRLIDRYNQRLAAPERAVVAIQFDWHKTGIRSVS